MVELGDGEDIGYQYAYHVLEGQAFLRHPTSNSVLYLSNLLCYNRILCWVQLSIK